MNSNTLSGAEILANFLMAKREEKATATTATTTEKVEDKAPSIRDRAKKIMRETIGNDWHIIDADREMLKTVMSALKDGEKPGAVKTEKRVDGRTVEKATRSGLFDLTSNGKARCNAWDGDKGRACGSFRKLDPSAACTACGDVPTARAGETATAPPVGPKTPPPSATTTATTTTATAGSIMVDVSASRAVLADLLPHLKSGTVIRITD